MNREEQLRQIFREVGSTDKLSHNYAPVYSSIPTSIESVLEVGVYWGRSMRAWLKAFPQAKVWGMDVVDRRSEPESQWNENGNPRVHFLQADIHNFDFTAMPDFDLIIDDCTHVTDDMILLGRSLLPKARVAYVTEDIRLERMMPLWQAMTALRPDAQFQFWRTSGVTGCGDEGVPCDSHCLVVRP